jgi:hypothetical protein
MKKVSTIMVGDPLPGRALGLWMKQGAQVVLEAGHGEGGWRGACVRLVLEGSEEA